MIIFIYLKPLNEKELLSMITDVKGVSAGVHGITVSIDKSVNDEILALLLHLLNRSLTSSWCVSRQLNNCSSYSSSQKGSQKCIDQSLCLQYSQSCLDL